VFQAEEMLLLNQLKEDLKAILESREPRRITFSDADYRQASVLMPLFINDAQFWLLFTRRTRTVEYHKGEVSFPGGVVDESDESWERTAIRETFEEIGVREEDIEILGQLDDTTTLTSQFVIHPFVGMIPFPYPFEINTEEVEHLIEVPFRFFLNHSQPRPYTIQRGGKRLKIPAFVYEDAVIWGATERILENFIGLIGPGIEA
jgi:8-oxo-dGTP pyrophosphatase MutT (NUDIX family)